MLVGLGVAGVLKPGREKKTVQLTGRDLPPGLTGPDHAAIALAGTESSYDQLRDALARRPEVAELRRSLEAAGLMYPAPVAAAQLRNVRLLWLAVLGLGVARLVVGMSRGKPVAFLVMLLVAAVFCALASLGGHLGRTPAGYRVLKAARREGGKPEEAASMGEARFGPVGASYGVALFGASVLWATDPLFAEAMGMPRAGGGDGDGGGGGCGGGGCGGGCGG